MAKEPAAQDNTATEPSATVFKYTPRDKIESRKEFDLLCQSSTFVAGIQTVGEGGETNLHSHRNLDGFWFVLRGRARFYTTDDELVADLGPMEGVLIPRNFPYWFERIGDGYLDLLQLEATDKGVARVFSGKGDRVDHAPPKDDLRAMRPEFVGMLKAARDATSA
jgi:mannose-6-phosphate isomerase-like protein (cupin superfamily)